MSAAATPLDRVRSQHFALRQQMRALEELAAEVAPAASGAVDRTLALLETFETALCDHFAFEEEGGYLADVLKVAPRLSRRARRLERNHGELRAHLGRVLSGVRRAAGAPNHWERARRELGRLLVRLRVHEDEENALVREAFRDLGPGD